MLLSWPAASSWTWATTSGLSDAKVDSTYGTLTLPAASATPFYPSMQTLESNYVPVHC